MDEYYVEYIFQTNDSSREFLFPIFIIAKTPDEAKAYSSKIVRELTSKFIVSSVSLPKRNYTKLHENYYKEQYGIHTSRNKVVQFNVITYKFNDYEPSQNLTFNENLKACLDENFPLQKDIAKSISHQQFPVRVLRDKKEGINQFNDYYIIDLSV